MHSRPLLNISLKPKCNSKIYSITSTSPDRVMRLRDMKPPRRKFLHLAAGAAIAPDLPHVARGRKPTRLEGLSSMHRPQIAVEIFAPQQMAK